MGIGLTRWLGWVELSHSVDGFGSVRSWKMDAWTTLDLTDWHSADTRSIPTNVAHMNHRPNYFSAVST